MRTWYKSIAFFLSTFMAFMHPLSLWATEVATSTSPSNSSTANILAKIPDNFIFTQDMYNGLDNDQVRILQIILNSDGRTVVNQTGPGSSGNETTYFGNATENAVNRFQTIYKSVILEPLGFTLPTGVIGAKSRGVLNQILENLRNNLPTNTNIFIEKSIQNTEPTKTTTPTNSTTNQPYQSVNNSTTNAVQVNTSTISTTNSSTTETTSASSSSNIGLALGIVGAAVAVGAVGSIASNANSAALPGFGGRLVYVQYCTCTAFLLLFIYDFDKKAVIQLMYIPGYSKLLSQYAIWTPGPLVLGGYTYGSSPCMVYVGTSCTSIGTPIGIIDSIRGIGTSAK